MRSPAKVQSARQRIFEVIQIAGGSDPASRAFDRCIITLIFLSIVVTTAQTFHLPSSANRFLSILEAVCMITFTVEYALRLWTADLLYPASRFPYLKFVFSPLALIDLFSILPYYLSGVIPAGMVVFRLIRVARILRLFRINQYLDPVSAILSVLRRKATMIFASLFLVFILLFSASLLMYYAEHDAQPAIFKNAFSGLWWSVSTLSTTGYGDIYPVTFLGKALAIVITLLGMCIVAVPTGIITAGFMEAGRYTDPGSGDAEAQMAFSGNIQDISTPQTTVFAPGFACEEGSMVEQVPLGTFVGPCIVETMNGEVTAERIGALISKASGESSRRILLRGEVSLTEEAASFLSMFKALIVGFSEGHSSDPENAKSHILLAGHVIILSNLDLSGINDGSYILHASPVLIPGETKAPCRAYLMPSSQIL
jgi:voltage-gated potassium channel